ncbi:MAG: hypothetical protein GXP54_12940 [Deltaproteobacteria bacterium]|nr:hypothetical protein [Deltaproteobacteria bacterium]
MRGTTLASLAALVVLAVSCSSTGGGNSDIISNLDLPTQDCVPACAGKQCGDDGCGGSCGECPGTMTCNPFLGVCTGTCVPDCAGRQCGPDGCLGSCGTCLSGMTCNQTTGQCEGVCAPDCDGKECGDNGCGGSCGTCPAEQVCSNGKCGTPASCDDGKKNGTESDIDCGGTCEGCLFGQACNSGNDCKSGICDQGFCSSPETCKNLTQDPGETDVDCGGQSCPPCALTKFCQDNTDCLSQNCYYGVCEEPSCTDGARNQGETDVDCGGPCEGCPDGKHCGDGSDCMNGSCVDGTCCQQNACGFCGKPPQEVCNGADDDCDGQTDESVDIVGGGPCPKQTGVCKGSFEQCFGADGWKCTVQVYQSNDPQYEPDEFKCDGLDNDCDGQTDEAPQCSCQPDCADKECGDNGCGGVCGTCPAGQFCDNKGKCQGGAQCGANPSNTCKDLCGGSGTGGCDCSALCTMFSNCCPDFDACCGTCEPSCAGKECGSDGCGGSCGSCGVGETCNNGKCVGGGGCGVDPSKTCEGYCGGKGVGSCYCDSVCVKNGDCCPDYDACCGACEPDCFGKECGSDGCGGSCGVCPDNKVCASGQCGDLPPIEEFGKSCKTDEDCYPGLVCKDIIISGAKICTMTCSTPFIQAECPDGWTCFGLGVGSNICINVPVG